jgi:hypothetical protein
MVTNLKLTKKIKIQTQFEGEHCWPDAPPEVSFLRNRHRHVFHVTAIIKVDHDDRDLEFFIVKRDLQKFISNEFPMNLGAASCEMIATTILYYLVNTWTKGSVSVEVSEDGENSAIVATP